MRASRIAPGFAFMSAGGRWQAEIVNARSALFLLAFSDDARWF